MSSAQTAPEFLPLWPGGAPGFEDRRDEPERAQDWWVKNVHNPSLTVFRAPEERANGAAVLVCPGGGHRELVFDAEGVAAATFFNRIGVTAFALKYRLADEENSPYTLDEHTRADVHRAMRTIRHGAERWGIDPRRIGIMGFSAGGELVTMVAYHPDPGDPNAADPIDREDAKPDFIIQVYPGGHGMPEEIPADAPPAFFLVARDDPWCADTTFDMIEKYRRTAIPFEAHIYAQGEHAFNMGQRSTLATLSTWPQRMADWMADSGFLSEETE